ncbi:MAG: hypothetical protein JSS00_10150 [Proteobacteria bacterium]|nr:hypothetical protein [Pseudomonadota bacterium]
MPKRTNSTDPYAPPPMYHDRSGRFVRIGSIAVLLAALGAGYLAWSASSPQQTAAVTPAPAQQQLADNGYRAQPEQIPEAQPVSPTPPAPPPAPERRRSAPSRASAPPAETAPPPVSGAPTTPVPVPPANTPQSPDSVPPTQG